ncbi:hypothetical protein GALMADRAFT_206888 [Galerina marginata CBS 339.88]|uniref:Uncharacterized protein n=1 Tax=Galerina marginata (strain CBS 339.88) TaxID=685588 RepID=A0A067TN53_GALM3|nr:hypothetical protein GALMADRAFT_206888 [Galerina marginata CBS 339.88]
MATYPTHHHEEACDFNGFGSLLAKHDQKNSLSRVAIVHPDLQKAMGKELSMCLMGHKTDATFEKSKEPVTHEDNFVHMHVHRFECHYNFIKKKGKIGPSPTELCDCSEDDMYEGSLGIEEFRLIPVLGLEERKCSQLNQPRERILVRSLWARSCRILTQGTAK